MIRIGASGDGTESVMLLRDAVLATALAGLLAGCSGLRGQRPSAPAAANETTAEGPLSARIKAALRPIAESTGLAKSSKTIPDNPPALYIPGSAVSARMNAVNATPVSSTATAASEPEPETTLPALTPAAAPFSDHPLQALADRATARWAGVDAYACRIRRREAIGGQPRPEELMVAKFRKAPYSVYLQFLGPEAKGREVVYVQGQHGNLIHTLTAAGDIPLVPGGTRFKIAPDSLLVKNKTRHPITEAGVGALVESFAKVAHAAEQGDPRVGVVKYLGQAKRTEFEDKVEVVLHNIPPGWDPLLSGGGKRLWCFDPQHGLPMLIVTYDHADHEVEYYCHDRFEFSGHFGDDEFNPDKLWGKKK